MKNLTVALLVILSGHVFAQLPVPSTADNDSSVATNLYAEGRYEEALPLFRQLAAKSDPVACYYLARMYSKGLGGLPEDHVEAFGFYERAALYDYAEAQYQVAVMYEEGQGVLKDEKKAASWYEKAAGNGHADAQYRFAEYEFDKAVFWQEESMRKESGAEGESDGEASIKRRQTEDFGKYKQRLSSAVSWYNKAAAQNHPEAQYVMGRLYVSGEGVGQNFTEAVRFYELAAAQGHAKAQFYLGLMAQAGLGVKQDLPKAIKLYEKAADKGETGAMYYLGNCYRFGIGVAKDADKGAKYYEKAMESAGRNKFWIPRKNRDELTENILKDEWLPSIAREYGIGLWMKADSEEAMDMARTLLGRAAQNGAEKAQDILLKMSIKARGDTGFVRPVIAENKADAHADAVRRRRAAAFFPVYFVGEKLKALYPDSKAKRNIASVRISNGRRTSVAGEKLWELRTRMRRPTVNVAADFQGAKFIYVEFTDRKSGQKYFHLKNLKIKNKPYNPYTDGNKSEYLIGSAYLNMNPYPDARLTGWAVVYGHLPKEETILAVFDSESEDGRTFAELVRDNANSKELELVAFDEGAEGGDGSDDDGGGGGAPGE
jgi:TPR repeat protein